jgi:hypothetical protein
MLGIFVATACFWAAALLRPGGYDWSREYLSTLLRGDTSPARILAITGLLIFCLSIGLVFDRLARTVGSSESSKVIRIGGVGSMVYASLAFTPMHDLMVTISVTFFIAAVLALLRVLYTNRVIGFLLTGIACLVLLLTSVIIYYTGQFISVLPWAQRILFALFAIWLIALDIYAPRLEPSATHQCIASSPSSV